MLVAISSQPNPTTVRSFSNFNFACLKIFKQTKLKFETDRLSTASPTFTPKVLEIRRSKLIAAYCDPRKGAELLERLIEISKKKAP